MTVRTIVCKAFILLKEGSATREGYAKRATDDDAFATDNPIATLNSTILGR